MAELRAHGVSVTFAAQPVLRDVDLHLSPGVYGLVGANGAGKSTLLRVLAGALEPSAGSVRTLPHGALVTLCPQSVDALSDEVAAFARAPGALHGQLGLRPDDLARWPTLSPGERRRWQIGAALASEPDVLLLDEPTNHLDQAARAKVLGVLRRFRGLAVVISHDRALLDALTGATLRVHHARVTEYAGSYSDASRLWADERARALEAHDRAKRRVRALEGRVDQARRDQEGAHAARSSRARMKGPRDHDARSALAKFRTSSAEARIGRSVAIARDELGRAVEAVPTVERDRTAGGRVHAPIARAASGALFHVDADAIGVLRDVRVTIGRGERVRIAGENGAGKSTLVRALLASRPSGVIYLPQELEHADVAAALGKLRDLPLDERGRVLSIVAALGSDPEPLAGRRSSDGASLSPGEARKLVLAFGLGASAVDALVLDEPENHLDLPTLERLEAALAAYAGCVVLVSHDERLASALTRRTLLVAHGRVT